MGDRPSVADIALLMNRHSTPSSTRTHCYEPDQYEDKEKKRVLEAIDAKIEGKQIVTPHEDVAADSGQVIDLTEALRASLARNMKRTPSPARTKPAAPVAELPAKPRKTVKRAEKVAEPVAAPARTRARR